MKMSRIYLSICMGLVLIWGTPVVAEVQKKTNGPLVSEPVGTGELLQMFLGLFIVLGIIFGIAWFVRRMGSFQNVSHGALRILGGLSIGQRERIILVQVGDTQLLVGLAPGQIRTLHVLEQSVTLKEQGQAGNISFADRLQSVLQGKQKK